MSLIMVVAVTWVVLSLLGGPLLGALIRACSPRPDRNPGGAVASSQRLDHVLTNNVTMPVPVA